MNRTAAGGLMMLGATAAWGSSYLFMRQGLQTLEPFNLIALRFGIGFLAGAAIFSGALRTTRLATVLWSAALGFLLNLCFWAVMTGLKSTATGKTGLLLGTTVIFVQLEAAAVNRRLPLRPAICALAAFAGIGLLTLNAHRRMEIGDWWCLASAFGYSWHILLSGIALKRTEPLPLGILQLAWTALFALLGALFWETPKLPSGTGAWTAVLVLGVVCSATGFLLQAEAQSRISTAETGILYAMEPVFALLLGMVFLGETLTIRGTAGAAAILAAVTAVQMPSYRRRPTVRAETPPR